MITRLILFLALVTGIGVFKGASDTIQFHHSRSRFATFENQEFWGNTKATSNNKYAIDVTDADGDGDTTERTKAAGPRYLGSTTFLVFLTDAWHLMQFGVGNCIRLAMLVLLSVILMRRGTRWRWWWVQPAIYVGAYVVLFAAMSLGFHLTYTLFP